ncbi:MAG: hypothetical protein WC212_09175 [Candidatus Delongbacteria bacterium]
MSSPVSRHNSSDSSSILFESSTRRLNIFSSMSSVNDISFS